MAAQGETVFADAGESEIRPIEIVTENGFGILRSWEINGDSPPTRGAYDFVVLCPDALRKRVLVEIICELMIEIEIHTCGRITSANSFWICCAENYLAIYLWEHSECPRDGRLRVETLSPSDLNLSLRWERT